MDALAPILDSATGRQELGPEECTALLRAVGWGVLAVAELPPGLRRGRWRATPLALPVAYAFHEGVLYVASGPGRKLRALERNPRLCLTVTDVQAFDDWRSVVVIGSARWLGEGGERAAAVCAFAAQHRPGGHTLGPADARRLLTARILRIEPDEIRGAARGRVAVVPPGAGGTEPPVATPDPILAAAVRASSAPDAESAMTSLRRLVRALHAASAASTRDLGVSSAQLFVLRQLAAAPGQSIGALARRTLTSPGTVSEVVARLVARGYVERAAAPDDRRRAELALTARGRGLLARAPQPVQERLVAALASLDEGEQRVLATALHHWISAAGLADEAAEMFFEAAE